MIDLNNTIAVAQLTFALILIIVLLLFLAFGKIDRSIKSKR